MKSINVTRFGGLGHKWSRALVTSLGSLERPCTQSTTSLINIHQSAARGWLLASYDQFLPGDWLNFILSIEFDCLLDFATEH